MNPIEKHTIVKTTTSDNVSFFIDNKSCFCPNENVHRITDRKKKWISEIL